MILAPNHRQPLNGNKVLFCLCLAVLLGACSPKVLRPGGDRGGKAQPKEGDGKKEKTEERPVETPKEEVVHFDDIALMLPFQLDKMVDSLPRKNDVERAGLALDFYQGFKLGLDQLADKGDNFRLHVLDTRDNATEVQRLARGQVVADAKLIVGPIFPTEINAFSNAANLSGKLQVSPLAARSPVSYGANSLVTVTPPIEVHAQVIGRYLVSIVKPTDQVLIFNNGDEDSEKLLSPLRAFLDKQQMGYKEVRDLEEIEASLSTVGNNIWVNASTNSYFIASLLERLYRLKTENAYEISLVGHPNWFKMDLNDEYLQALNTCISSSYYVDEKRGEVKQFQTKYQHLFKVAPSEFAFKGYDTGIFFGNLLARQADNYVDLLTRERYHGISIGFEFMFDPKMGYINNSVGLLRFVGNSYRPFK